MSMSEQTANYLVTVAENQQKVYNAGYENGKAEGGLPEWDDDSPIIASGKSWKTSNVVWELTEKGTFRWKIIDYNDKTNAGFEAYICNSTALSMSPLAYQEICTKIKQIYIPDGIKRTEFHYAINCERIRVPDTLISRPNFTFMASLRELDCSSEIYNAIPDYAFANMFRLEKITLSSTLTTLNLNSFRYCYSLKEINLDNIINFKGSCLYECFSLDKDIVFSSNLTNIADVAFCRTRIKSVTFQTPTGDFPTVSTSAFSQCRNLTDVWLFDGWNMSVNFLGSDLSQASLHDMIEKYADMAGQEAPIIQVGSKNLEKIDDEHKAMATAKNVTLA